ncbi:hypothetical protein [Pseudomonas bubulae]|uniref:hypothetical protein n=1 Tax=Pseudomonas bubulae TaxID=2316085 RepID=UPI001F23E9B6|nr:hypothetical protein [Pseudomonas bubulae]MCF3195549.1 hypothetical protein [Pseudomonas bubulae]
MGIQGCAVKAAFEGLRQPGQRAGSGSRCGPPKHRQCLFVLLDYLGRAITDDRFDIRHIDCQQLKRDHRIIRGQPVLALAQGLLRQPGSTLDHERYQTRKAIMAVALRSTRPHGDFQLGIPECQPWVNHAQFIGNHFCGHRTKRRHGRKAAGRKTVQRFKPAHKVGIHIYWVHEGYPSCRKQDCEQLTQRVCAT